MTMLECFDRFGAPLLLPDKFGVNTDDRRRFLSDRGVNAINAPLATPRRRPGSLLTNHLGTQLPFLGASELDPTCEIHPPFAAR